MALPPKANRLWSQGDVAYPRSRAPLLPPWRPNKAQFQLNLTSRVTSTVISVIYINVSSYSHEMTLIDMTLDVPKRPYVLKFIAMATRGEPSKDEHFCELFDMICVPATMLPMRLRDTKSF